MPYLKEVEFAFYCSKCKYSERTNEQIPCTHCLEVPGRKDSKKPIKYEPKEDSE